MMSARHCLVIGPILTKVIRENIQKLANLILLQIESISLVSDTRHVAPLPDGLTGLPCPTNLLVSDNEARQPLIQTWNDAN